MYIVPYAFLVRYWVLLHTITYRTVTLAAVSCKLT